MKSYAKRILSIILIMVFVLATTQLGLVLAAEGRTAKIYDFNNEVTVKRGKAELKVFKGMRLKEGDTIKTGKSSNAYIEIDSDKVIKLDSSTIVTISNMSGTAEDGSINISLSSGKIYNDIKKKLTENSTYKIKTPNAVMGVRGTTFVVDTNLLEDKSNETVLTVLDGTVAFAPSGHEELNVYVKMNQKSNTIGSANEKKSIVKELHSKDLSTFELTEIMKDDKLLKNINKLLDKEDKTIEEVLKQAEKQEKQEQDEKAEAVSSNSSITGSNNANENSGTNPGTNNSSTGSNNANENSGTNPSTNSNTNENAGRSPSTNSSTNPSTNPSTNQRTNGGANDENNHRSDDRPHRGR